MGYAFMVGTCVGCKRTISFNPSKVPSIIVGGVKEPICAPCIKEVNKAKAEQGIELWPEPHPDAYLPCDENELPF